jgi:hypothetical protein
MSPHCLIDWKLSMNLIENIPVELEATKLVKSLRIRRNVPYMTDKLSSLIETIKPIMNPKALYTVRYVNGIEGDSVTIGENVFTSKVLRINLEAVGRVFPYLVTAGTELDNVVLPEGQSEMLLGLVKTVVVSRAFQYLQTHLAEKYRIPIMSSISPERLDEWPIDQQRELFRIFGNNIDLLVLSNIFKSADP